ncbi:hypothetical protein SB3_30035, partial [Methylobacterium radiotolerans]
MFQLEARCPALFRGVYAGNTDFKNLPAPGRTVRRRGALAVRRGAPGRGRWCRGRCPPRALLILGTEGPGLDAATLARARPIRIPMAAGFDSLNVATAAGIAL